MSRLTIDQALEVAVSHHRTGRLAEAEALYRQILSAVPNHPKALHWLALIAGQVGRLDVAIELLGKAIEVVPKNATLYFDRAIFLERQGQNDQAIASYQSAIDRNSDYLEAQINLGNIWRQQKKLDRAKRCFERALQIKPDSPEALISIGNILNDLGELDQAISFFQRAMEISPGHSHAATGLANALVGRGIIGLDLGAIDQAAECFQQAINAKPDDPRAHHLLGNALVRKDQPDEAIASYQQAISLYQSTTGSSSDLSGAMCMLGHALNRTGQIHNAIAVFRDVLLRDPTSMLANDLILYDLIFDPSTDAAGILAESREWNRRFALPVKPAVIVHNNDANPTRRLKIGYVSADFHRHVANHFMLPLLASHDPAEVEVFCYANVKRPDEITAKMMTHAHLWRDIASLCDDAVAEMIRFDQIDILVDLNLHMADHRLLVFARKPAPVQVTFLGYPGTTGLDTIAYRLTDSHLDPPDGDDSCYSEKSFRLPDTFWCYDPLEEFTTVNPPPAFASGRITFGCLNDFQKVNEQAIELWTQILKRTAGSRLLLLAPMGKTRDRVRHLLDQHSIAPQRVEFVARQPRTQYLQTYHQIDICLDTFPCNGHTTSLDAMWMGVPVVTLAGSTVAGRAGVSQLTNLRLQELIADTPDQYVQIASDLADDLPRLTELRASLRDRMKQSALMDAPRFARGIEKAYRTMWQKWCGH
jgi:protein O-GlcNAc transferase